MRLAIAQLAQRRISIGNVSAFCAHPNVIGNFIACVRSMWPWCVTVQCSRISHWSDWNVNLCDKLFTFFSSSVFFSSLTHMRLRNALSYSGKWENGSIRNYYAKKGANKSSAISITIKQSAILIIVDYTLVPPSIDGILAEKRPRIRTTHAVCFASSPQLRLLMVWRTNQYAYLFRYTSHECVQNANALEFAFRVFVSLFFFNLNWIVFPMKMCTILLKCSARKICMHRSIGRIISQKASGLATIFANGWKLTADTNRADSETAASKCSDDVLFANPMTAIVITARH